MPVSNPNLRPLDVLGISDAEEHVYRHLLQQPGATRAEIARRMSIAPRAIQPLLESIEAKGLATHSPEQPRRYIPAWPDLAIEALILRRQEDLQRARLAAQELQEQAVTVRRQETQEHIVELIAAGEAERLLFEQMHLGAQQEIITLMRPPMRISSLAPPYDHSLQSDAFARGVSFRTIVDAEFLDMPGAIGLLRSEIAVGTQARGVPHLPFKMVLADHRLAIIPLNLEQAASKVLLVRSSALLDALYALFEILWSRGAPIGFSRDGDLQPEARDGLMPDAAAELIPLMAAGLNDKAIAHELGMSARTFERRMVALMKELGARTRFQAGWLAALQTGTVDGARAPGARRIAKKRSVP
jgi:sugar-specific transcriptional regulator TrmB